jgi:mRNA-degrading endonuclease RelE of RelBE toxin-antitoxin system
MFIVMIRKRAIKSIEKMPKSVQAVFRDLVKDLELKGPEQPEWANYSKLSKNEYHCHLSYRWIACWRHEKNTVVIEVYYAGSRENAPY